MAAPSTKTWSKSPLVNWPWINGGDGKTDASSASGMWVSLAEHNPPSGRVPPSLVRFPAGETVELRGWSDVIVSVADWQAATGRLAAANVPVASGNRGYIVNDLPVHPTGKAFSRCKTVGNGLVVFAPGYSASNARKLVRKLLERCGVSVGAVGLQVGSSVGG